MEITANSKPITAENAKHWRSLKTGLLPQQLVFNHLLFLVEFYCVSACHRILPDRPANRSSGHADKGMIGDILC